MAVTNFVPQIWSHEILRDVELECKLVDHCYRQYEGDVRYGGSVKILGIGNVIVRDYKKQDIEIQELDDKGQVVNIDQMKYFAFIFDDVDRAQSIDGLLEATREEAVHDLAVHRDSFVANLIKTGTNVTTAASLDNDGVKNAVDAGIVALKERNCNEELYIELSPAAAMAFLNSLTIRSTDNPEYIKKGIIGHYHGCKVIESNNMAKDGSHVYCAIRSKKAVAFVAQLEKVTAMPVERRFGDLVKGLDVYGGKVIDDNRLQVIKIPLSA